MWGFGAEKWRSVRDPAVLLALAAQTYKQGKPKKALEIYRRLVELAPDSVPARVNLGALIIQCHNDLPEALVHMEYARTLEPDNCTVLLNLGSLYAHLEMPERSEEMLRRAIEINPSFPDVRFLLAHHLINRGEMDEARRLLAEELSPGVKPGNLQAQILLARLNEFRKQSADQGEKK